MFDDKNQFADLLFGSLCEVLDALPSVFHITEEQRS